MACRIDENIWKLYEKKKNHLTYKGLRNKSIDIYDDLLIEKLRDIYYGGIPASILLLSDMMTNGFCYDRALLLSRAFLDTDDDINLIYADIDSLRLNPKYKHNKEKQSFEHCFLEKITKDGKHLIYDTATGLIYDKKIYWMIEHPKVRKINKKEDIIDFYRKNEDYTSSDVEKGKYAAPIIIPLIESNYDSPYEMYANEIFGTLQREVEHYKQIINYDCLCMEIEEDIKQKGIDLVW